MAGHHILIVDDQRETTRILRASLESLQKDFKISDMLSGEEAILEIGRGQIDLLVADILLPGITGLELMNRFKAKHPEIKVILISGVSDPKIRQQVAQAGADAFFFKPIEIADFLDAVERALGLVDTILPSEMDIEREEIDQEQEAKGMSERIADLRDELDASSAFLVGDMGQILVRAGTLPDVELEQTQMSDLISTFSTSQRVAHFISPESPHYFLAFHGDSYDIFITNVGEAYYLLITTDPVPPDKTGKISTVARAASADILKTMTNLGISTQAREGAPEVPAEKKEKPALDPDLSDPELESLFGKQEAVKKEDADAFWEAMSEEKTTPELGTGDSLTYEQAKQLGLAPSDD